MKLRPLPLLAFFALAVQGAAFADPGDLAPAQPAIPSRAFTLASFGGDGNGQALNTTAFKKAIAAVKAAGGGTLEVPAGTYLTGPFSLCSLLNLHLNAGATILFTPEASAYGSARDLFQLSAGDLHDVEVSGSGTIDGNGAAWWDAARARRDPATGKQFAGGTTRRPRLLVFDHCKRVRVEGVTLRNSPFLNLGPNSCQDVTVEGITILNPPDSPNTDGIDPKSCERVLIAHCRVDTGDDCVAAGGNASGGPEKDILVTDCTFLHGHGCSIGSGTSSTVRNFIVRRCIFEGTATGIRLKSARGRGGVVENLVFQDLDMKGVGQALSIDGHYEGTTVEVMPADRDQAAPLSPTTPEWRNIRVRNLHATSCTTAAGLVLGLPEMPVQNLTLEHVSITAPTGLTLAYTRNVTLRDVHIKAKDGTSIIADPTDRDLNR